MIRIIILTAALVFLLVKARAHDQWADGTPVPSWIKGSCCGPADAHRLTPDQVHEKPDGIHIDGLDTVVPYDKVFPSQDGQIWGFWNDAYAPGATIYCFFYSGSI